MAITIRNKETEAMIRKLGKRWDAGPSAVIRRLAENEIGAKSGAGGGDYERLSAAIRALRRKYPPPAEKLSPEELKRERDAIFAERGEDLPPAGRSG